MSPFEPTGSRARWRIIYDLLTEHDVDDVLTYEDLASVLELDPVSDRHAIQMAVRRAGREYETSNSHALEPVNNVGYRIVEPVEHMRLAKAQQRRSNRTLARGRSKVVNVDLSSLDVETRKAFEVMAQAFAMQMDFNRRTDVRQKRLEEALGEVVQQTTRSADEIRDLQARLQRLEENQKP